MFLTAAKLAVRASLALALFVCVTSLLSGAPSFAGDNDSIKIGRVYKETLNAVTGKGAPIAKLADLEEEARARVKELLERPGFLVSDPTGAYLPSPLAKLMSLVVEKNPDLALMRSDVEVMAENAKQMGAYMDPMVGIMLSNHMIKWPWDTMEPMTMEEFKYSQSFMSYGKRSSMKKIAAMDVRLAEIAAREAEYNMSGDVIGMYYDLLENAVRIEMLDKRKALLEVMLEIARARYELNMSPLSDVLAVQKMLSEIGAMNAELEMMRGSMTSELAGMIGIPESELEFELIAADDDGPAAPGLDAEDLWLRAYDRHPELTWLTVWDEQLAEKARLAEKDYHPDYTLELNYGYRERYTDMVSLGIMFNLPIYQRDRQDPAYREVAATREQVPIKEEALLNKIRREGGAELSKFKLIEPRISRIREELIPVAESAFDASIAGYQVGKTMFADLLMAEIDLVDFETDFRLALVDRARARSRLYYLTLGAVADTGSGDADNGSGAAAEAPAANEGGK